MEEKIKSWKIAKVTKEMRDIILARDNYKCCIKDCDNNYMLDIHHILFWTETIYDATRNTPVNLITVCRDCHTEIHSCKKGIWKRQESIDYVSALYKE